MIKRKYVIVGFALFSVLLGSVFYTSITRAQTVRKDVVEITLMDWASRMATTDPSYPTEEGVILSGGPTLIFPYIFTPKTDYLNTTDMWITIIVSGAHQTHSFDVSFNDLITIPTSHFMYSGGLTEICLHIETSEVYDTLQEGLNTLELSNSNWDFCVYRVTVFIEYNYQPETGGSNMFVGGFHIPVDKLGLMAPYIALFVTTIMAVSVSVAYVKTREKQETTVQ